MALSILISLLDKICGNDDYFYIIDANAYKKMIFLEFHHVFLSQIQSFYPKSKHSFLTRTLTYNSFTTIIRQILRKQSHPFHTKLQCNHSIYTVIYFIEKPCLDKDNL